MHRHIKLGYTYSDIVDHGQRHASRSARKRPAVFELANAAFYRREATRSAFTVGITQRTPENCKIWAREHIRKAIEWRLEVELGR